MIGPGEVDGSIFPNVMLPLLVPVKAQAGVIVMRKALLPVLFALSLTVTVKEADVPETTGVPEITPVFGFNVSPDGRLPKVTDHV